MAANTAFAGFPRLCALAAEERFEPLLEYMEEIIDQRQPNETITVVVPQFIPSKRWHNALHMRTANFLRQELLSKPGVFVTDVPYQVDTEEEKE